MEKLIKYFIIINVIITLMMLPLVAFSQNLDSLWMVWNDDSQADSARLKAINSILNTSRSQIPITDDSVSKLAQVMHELALNAGLKKFQADALKYLGRSQSKLYNHQKALDYYAQRLSLCNEMNDKKGMAETYVHFGFLLKKQNRYKEALSYFNKGLEKYKEISDSISMASCLSQIGYTYYQQSNYIMARSHFESSLRIYEALNNQRKIMALKENIMMIFITKGDYNKALPTLIENKNYNRTKGYDLLVAVENQHLGNIYLSQGKYDLAHVVYQESLEIFQQEDIKQGIAYIFWAIGQTYKNQGNLIKALDYIKKSENIHTEINFKIGIAACLTSYGKFYFELDNYDVALGYLQKALEIYEEIENNHLIADVYSLMGGIYLKLADYSQAYNYYEMSLSIFTKIEVKSDIAAIYNKIGIYFKEFGDLKNAKDYLMRSKEILEEIGHKKDMAEVYIGLGDLNIFQGNLSKGIDWCKKGYDIAVEIGVLTLEQEAASYLYKAHKAMGNDIPALNFLERFLELQDTLRTDETSRQLQQMEFVRQRTADSLIIVEEKLITDLAYQETLSQERNSRNIFIFVGLGILLLAVGIFSRMVFVRRTNKELERRNKIISREKERAEASEKAKEQFFNNISHEFRTPLTLILGPLNETLEKTTDDKMKPSLQIMQRNALRLQEMINELLDLSKLEFGKVKLLTQEENIVKLTEDYIQSFESLADQRRIKLKFKSHAKEYKAWVDSEKFEKILANLLSNAFKYTNPKGEIKVNISNQLSRVSNISGKSSMDKGVYITVSDSGIGIAKENLTHIFDRFYQVGEASQAHHAGTGIGLALAKELVELHHGSINVISEMGKGTTFTVFIPFGQEHFSDEEIFVKETEEREAEKTEWAVDKEISGNVTEEEVKKKNELPVLLITEDNVDMRAYIKTHLEKAYTIIEAGDGEAGLQAAIDNVPDLIISDVMMPRMDGYEMTEKIKTDPRTNHIPVIILTARASVESKIEGLETGADAYVTKPFDGRELKVRVKKMIEQRAKLREHFSRTLETLDTYLVKDPQLPSMDQQFVKKAIDVVQKHMAEDGFNASTFAREMALSRVQLHRKIKALTNKTTTEFIRTIRLNRAASLLKTQTANVTEIAYEVGFSSLSYFTSSFTAQFGSTPSAFIQKNKTGHK